MILITREKACPKRRSKKEVLKGGPKRRSRREDVGETSCTETALRVSVYYCLFIIVFIVINRIRALIRFYCLNE